MSSVSSGPENVAAFGSRSALIDSRAFLLASSATDAAEGGSILTGPHILGGVISHSAGPLPAIRHAAVETEDLRVRQDALVSSRTDVPAPEVDVPHPTPDARSDAHARWFGAERTSFALGGETFHLTFCYVGQSASDPANPTVVDPELEIGEPGDLPRPRRKQFAAYEEFSPAERRAYLEWVSAGRQAADVPRSFLLQFVSTLEHAFLRDGTSADVAAARSELHRLAELHSKDAVFGARARQLITALELVDPSFVPAPIYASAEANYRAEMPFNIRQFLGWMLKCSGRLEGEAALLLCLQQAHTRLEPAVAQFFRELHALWCHRFPQIVGIRAEDISSLPRLKLTYEPVAGGFEFSWESDLPDVAALPLPASFTELFDACVHCILQLRDVPVGRLLSNVPVLDGALRPATQLLFQPRPGVGAELEAIVPGVEPQTVQVAELLSVLFDAGPLNRTRQVPKKLMDQVSRTLDELGFGFEPDSRFGMPKGLRPDARVALFRTEKVPHEEPTDAYLLAQAAVVVSTLGQIWFPGLEPLRLELVEERLPYRHRYTDRECRRLAATAVAVAHTAEPRKFLERWARILARDKRIGDLVRGFGLAFRGQRRNSQLPKLARALSLASPIPLEVDELLEMASAKALCAEQVHTSLDARVRSLQQAAAPAAATLAQSGETEPDVTRPNPALLEGLDASLAELLLALFDRPRTRAEFEELVRTRRVSTASSVDQINEWALMRIGTAAIREDDGFTIALPVADYLAATTAQS